MRDDLDSTLAACRARKARAAKDLETAENDYNRRLLDGDGRASGEQKRMDAAAGNLRLEEDREKVLLGEIAKRNDAAKQAKEREAFAKRQAALAEMEKIAADLDRAATTTAEAFCKLLSTASLASSELPAGFAETVSNRIASIFVGVAGDAAADLFPEVAEFRRRGVRTVADFIKIIVGGMEKRKAA